jgi:hypothetical protein
MNARTSMKGALVAALLAVSGCGDPAYTYTELMDAEVACDAEAAKEVNQGLRSVPQPGTGYDHTTCLHKRLPDLTWEELDHFPTVLEDALEAELNSP